jgi:hypothetical protein
MLVGLMFYSCTQQIDFEKEYLTKQLVLNSIITPDSTIKVKLYSTISINEGYPIYVTDAKVLLFKNNEIVENLELKYHTITGGWNYEARRYNIDTIYYYQSTKTVAETGNEYKLVVSHADYPTLTCKTEIPVPVEISLRDTAYRYERGEHSKEIIFNFLLNIAEPANSQDFYRIFLNLFSREKTFKHDPEGNISLNFKEYERNPNFASNDPVFRHETEDANNILFGTSFNYYNLFSDKLINGKKYDLSFNSRNGYSISGIESTDTVFWNSIQDGEYFHFTIELHHLSKDTYLYFKSIDAQQGTDHLSFIEPVQVYSNIENGVGIFGSYSVSKYEVTFGEYPIERPE